MLDRLRGMISSVGADFVDVRYEVEKETTVSYSGKDLKEVTACTTDGYVTRVLRGSGFASTTVTRVEDVPRGLSLAAEGAEMMVRSKGKQVRLADAPVIEPLGTVAAAIGHLNVTPDVDGAVRTEPLVLSYFDQTYPALSLMIAAKSLNLTPADLLALVVAG